MEKNDIYAEVVSDEEYKLALLCGFSDDKIIFNGPIKSKHMLNIALKNNAYVNLDSKKDLEAIKNFSYKLSKVGLRVNVDTSLFNEEDISFEKEGFRFGFSEHTGELDKAIDVLEMKTGGRSFGLHLHCNSKTRSLNVYKVIANYALYLIEKYNLEPEFIDIGGGFFGGIEGKPTAHEYISVIYDILKKRINPQKTKLIIEPGSAFIGLVVDLHTTVVDTKCIKEGDIITTDGSRILIDPMWSKTSYTYSIISKKSEISQKQIICGYTCMDYDRLMVLDNKKRLSIGDKIVYHRVGADSMTFGGMFIKYDPRVFVKSGTNLICVRDQTSIEEYFNLQTCKK